MSGWISDKFGVEIITVILLALSIPFYALLIIRGSLALFIVCFAIASELNYTLIIIVLLKAAATDFMLAALVSPLTTELANVVRNVDGVGCRYLWAYAMFG